MTTPSLPPTPPTDPAQSAASYPPAGAPGTPAWPVGPEPYQAPVIQPVKANPPKRSSAGGLLLGVAAVIAVGGIAFAAGRLTAPANASSAAAGGFGNGAFANGNRPNGSFDPAGAAGFARRALTTEATVTAVGPDSLTIQIGTNGQTIDVKTDSSTTYHTQQPATSSAVTVGSKVLLQFNASTATPGSSAAPAPNASAAPGQGGFLRNFGTVRDVTVLAAQ